MTDAVLSLKGVTKTYPGFRLGPVDLRIERGYMVAVVGPNGSGKSTLFRMLTGLAHPDSGAIRAFGEEIADDIALRSRIGYVPERATGHDRMGVGELGAFYARWFPAFECDRYDEAIGEMEIHPGQAFSTLSKGMQRRVSFALTMATDPELLLLDELSDGVDPFARREMVAEIARFMASGERTVVFATHNMEEVRRLADYVVFLVDGRCLGVYEKDALMQGWRRAWVERVPESGTPGVVAMAGRDPVEIVSSWWEATARALETQGIVIERTAPLELTEILDHLMRGRNGEDGNRPYPVAGETRSVRMP